ncbi:hypothetical protein XI01_05190 [Bradyrhizobium sp. CCBAU 21360]|nr:hypothetical protein [Bradyrhizobium sp. CCBAU 21360]
MRNELQRLMIFTSQSIACIRDEHSKSKSWSAACVNDFPKNLGNFSAVEADLFESQEWRTWMTVIF